MITRPGKLAGDKRPRHNSGAAADSSASGAAAGGGGVQGDATTSAWTLPSKPKKPKKTEATAWSFEAAVPDAEKKEPAPQSVERNFLSCIKTLSGFTVRFVPLLAGHRLP